MNRRLFLTALACVASIASPAMASQRDCHADPRSGQSSILLLLDRTTNLDATAKDRWRRGIAKLISDRSLHGEMRVLEVRENATELEVVRNVCLDESPTLTPPEKQGLSGLWRSAIEWWSGPSSDRDAALRRAKEDHDDRSKFIVSLQKLINVDRPTRSETEIAQSLIAALQANCVGRRHCSILVYSDFLDSNAKAHLDLADPRGAGIVRARELLGEYDPPISDTTVDIRCWGFGRDDVRPGRPLDDHRRMALRAYWSGFFETIRKRAKEGSVQFVDFL
jgi:hypothetical protein